MIYRDDLERVYALIERPEAWTKEELARNEFGEAIDDDYDFNDEGESLQDYEKANHQDARCWCLIGAGYKCGITDDISFSRAVMGDTFLSVVDFNDSHTHAEVLALLRSAIERAPVRP